MFSFTECEKLADTVPSTTIYEPICGSQDFSDYVGGCQRLTNNNQLGQDYCTDKTNYSTINSNGKYSKQNTDHFSILFYFISLHGTQKKS